MVEQESNNKKLTSSVNKYCKNSNNNVRVSNTVLNTMSSAIQNDPETYFHKGTCINHARAWA